MIGRSLKCGALATLAMLLAIGVASCGGDDDSTTDSSVATQTAPPDGTREAAPEDAANPDRNGGQSEGSDSKQGGGGASGEGSASTPAPSGSAEDAARRDSGGGSARFRVPGGDNSIQDYGTEASESEREEAAVVLHAFLAAQASEDWAAVCTYLSQRMHEQLDQLAASSPGLKGKGCAATVAALLGGALAAARDELTVADVGSLRIEGDSGFLLYRGARDTDFTISVVREGDVWKIGALAPTPIPKGA